MALLLLLFVFLSGMFTAHYRFLETHIRKVKEEYELEGVLWEAITLLESQGKGFERENLELSFSPFYRVSITRDTITVSKEGITFLRAQFRWQGEEIELIQVEDLFVQPYTR
ncbi:MAG: hypothetical protein ACUVQZ_05060 [Candidatus Caldatribacteriaceae bacterium]